MTVSMMALTAPTSELADGGKRESPAGGARGGGHPVRARLTLCGVREWAARGVRGWAARMVVMPA